MEELKQNLINKISEFAYNDPSDIQEVNYYLHSKYKQVLNNENIVKGKINENKFVSITGIIANIIYDDAYDIHIEKVK